MKPDGFATADIDTGLLHDAKIVALHRHLGHDDSLTCTAITLYLSTVLASWRTGERLSLDDALPAWSRISPNGVSEALMAVKLLDRDGKVPKSAWASFYEPARDRRQRRRESGAIGGSRSHPPKPDTSGA